MGFVYNVTKGRTEYLIGLDEGGAGGGTSKKKIIIKSDTIPEASAKTYKLIYIYAGESNGTYHHGYIYECVADVTYDAKNIYFDSHNMGFDYRNADPSKNFTTDGEAMEAFLELVLRDKDVSFLQVTNGALSRKATGMWNVQLKDKDGNILLDNYQLYPEDLESFGFVFLQQQSDYVVGEPEDFNFVWEQTSISNYRWEQLDVQPGGSSGDLSIYQLKMNMTQDPNSTSQGTYPSSYALSEAVKATLTVFENNTGTVLETGLTLGNSVLVFINGSLLEAGAEADYIINGNQIIFNIPLQSTDKVTIINGNLRAIDLSPYQLKLGATNVITTGEGNIVDGVSADSGTVTVTKNTTLSTVATSGDYNDLNNKPDLTVYQPIAQIIEDSSATPGGNDGLAIQANKIYKFTNANITAISFTSCEQSELVTKIDFTTGATAPQFIDNSNIDWADGETPHFYAYQHYWIIISNGVGFVKEIY